MVLACQHLPFFNGCLQAISWDGKLPPETKDTSLSSSVIEEPELQPLHRGGGVTQLKTPPKCLTSIIVAEMAAISRGYCF